MKTYLGKRQRLRLAALVVGGLLCSTTANAANLVSTIPSDYGNSEMGTVTGSRVTTNIDATPQAGVLKNLNRDPASFGFHQKGKSMILLRQYTYSTTELENTSLIDPNSAGAAASAATGKTTAVPNMHAAAASDEYIYMTGYDLGQIGVVRQNGKRLMENKRAVVNLKNDIKQYCGYNFTETFKNLDEDSKGEKGKTYTGDPAKAQVHGEALLVDGRRLYVAASVNPLAGYDPYDDGFLMQYDIQDDGTLKFGSYTRISRNIDQGRLNKFNDHILVSCIGGYQHYNGTGNTHYTALNIAKIDQNTGRILGTEQRRASIPNHVKGTGEDMRDLKLLPDGTAYVMTYNLSPSGSQINAHVYKTTMSNLMSEHPDDWQEVAVASQQEGWFGKLNAEYYTKRLWLELGDTLQAYTDGDDTAKHIWQAKDFSDNKAFSRFNKITMIEPDRVYGNTASVVMTLPAELGGDTTAATVNENAVWKNSAAFSDTITTQQSWNIDTVVSIGKDKLGDKSTNVLAAISATDSRPLNINAGENILQLQVENTVGNPTGIYARGADLTVSAKKGINILTRGSEGGNSLTNAVQLDALKNKATKLTINGPLNISMTGGLGGNGVAIQKSDRFGEKSYEARLASAIRINGNLKIAGTETDKWGIPLNRENVFSRFNNAGILTQVEKSDVTVDGDVDMTVYGNGVTTNAKDSSVHIAGGGSIQVPAGMRYSYYALAAYQGAISMNMGDDGTKPGNPKEGKALADVKLDGDLFALPTGRLDVALMTDKSYLHGLVDNGGTANLYLQNGAKWLNEARNERYYQDDEDMGAGTMAAVRTRTGGTVGKVYNAQSHVTNFVGGATEAQRGIIYQKNANPLTIDKYSGHTAAVYSHDIASPTVFTGGEIIIKKANADTKNIFTLFTDGGGVTTGNQSAVLNALANKLSYQSFAENKLLGKLSIGESLTTSTINGEITFGNETGSYAGGTTPPSTEQTKTEFTKRLFGTASDQEYVDANVRQPDGTYRFSKDSNISYANTDDEDAGVISPTEDVKIDASGHTLTVETKVQGAQKSAAIKNTGKKLNITADALRLFTNKNEVSDAIFSWGILNESGTTNISGLTEIDTTGYNSSRAVEATEGTVTLEGLKAKVAAYDDAAALFTGSTGQIHVNAKDGSAGNKTVKIDGNVGAMGEASRIDVAMVNKDSGVNGLAFGKGKINFWLQNGAVWNNEQYGGTVPDKEDNQLGYDYDYTFAGSRLSSLRGGNDANNAGVIFQKNSKDITIDDYNGHTRVFYEHDTARPTTIKGGDFRIKNASAGSAITLTTDSGGLNTESTKAADKNLVSATLNALANKLWYTAYTTNERNLTGKVEIAEGLTSSSASKRLENITFDTASGQGRYVYTPQSEATTDPIKESETLTYDRQALATAPNTKGGRIVSGLYTDNTAYDKQHPMVVDMNGHSLHIEANSKNQIASAIHGGNNKYIRIVNSGEKKALTIKASNTDTRAANGIQTEANGHIHIQGPVVIEDVHTKGYNAAAIQTNGTIGSPSDVTIDGDLTVQSVRADRVDTKNKGADDGRNVAGLKTTADESKITVKGNVDIQNIKGSVLQTIGADSVIDVGGGTISAAEDADHTKQYRAVRAEKGTVNINTPEGVSGSRKTNITGDMYVTREYGKKVVEYSGGQLVDFDKKGMLNVSLTTADSSWTGAATYDVNRKDYGQGGFTAHDVGQFNLTLQNGARWTNELRSGVTDKWLGSHVSRLSGGSSAQQAGLIFQKDERKITIDNYSGYARVFYEHDAATPTNIKGGDIDVKSASGGSRITLITDQRGLNTSTTAGITEKNLVNATLNALANKLWYTGYVTNERNLLGQVQIAEGLTSSSASKRLEDITFDKTTGQGSYVYTPLINPPASQTQSDFTTAITGDETHDTPYVNAGVRKADGRYVFTKDSTITSGKDLIAAGAWMSNISAAISSANKGTLDLDLSGKNLTIKTKTDVSTTGISSIGKDSKVIVKNAGAISIDAESTNHGQTATLFVNGGGAIHIQNGGSNLEDKVLKVRANGNSKTNVAVVKSMNGVTGVESNITIDGLVDVLADGNDAANGKGANEGVSAVASTIDIGGGTIRAINGAWAAIRAYGEFVSDNYGTVNFNVTKGADGLANGAGTNRAVIEGDIVTNGGMGTKGRVSVGLSTANSHWIGNYADTRGYGVTPGALGAVNLFMKNGSYWKGFSNGTMKVEMSGAGTSWTGFNLGDNMQLKLFDGAIWHNAITQEQKDQDGKAAISKVKYFTGEGGFIDMTGRNRFLASSNSLSGAPVQTGSSSIEEKGLGETGDLTIGEFSGSTTMLYRHDATTPTTIYGGKLTIGKAAAGSLVRMVTDNTGLNTESTKAADKNLVSATLNALASKLWYTAYTTGERNLTGKAEIAEGLTTSSASKRVENITFNESSGQGGYAYTPAVDPPKPPQPGQDEQTTTEFTKPLIGTDSDQEYIDAHVRQADGTYRFTKDSTITYQNNVSGARGAIMPSADVHINAADRVLTIKSGSGIASVTQGAAIANYGKGLDIKAKTLKLLVNGTTSAAPLQTAWGILSTGGTTNISGMTEIDVAGTERSKAVQAYDGTVTLEGLRAKANAASKDAVTLDVQGTGRINVNVKDGTVGSSEVMLDGNITARESGSRVDAALTTGTSYLKGLVSGVGTLNLWLQNGAVWHNEEYTTQPTGFSSRLSNFTGGSDASRAGVIFQKNNNDISIDNYSGYARVFYKHDAGTPTTIIGGDLRIKNAAAGSGITLATDNVGLNTESTKAADKNLVSATLNALANKLWYTAYTTGERNLTGKAEIAEGLTTSSASKRVENITFNESTGQGGYAYTPAVDPPKPPQPGQDEQTTTEFTTPITGDAASDADYVAGHVLKNNAYTFTKNSKITAATGIQAIQNKPIKVQAAGAELKIQAADYGVDAGANSKVAITGKQLTIDAGSRSIRAAAGSDISVAAGFDLKGAIENNGGRISLNDMGRKSSLVGDITQTAGSFNLRMQGVDSKLKGNIIASGGVLDLSMEGAGATFTGSIRGAGSAREAGTGDRRLTLENRTVWNVTSPSNLTRLNAKQGSVINYLFSHNEGVNVENFKGSATVHYNGTATSDGTLTLANTGKFRIRNVDGTGNALTIATDAHGGSDTADERVAKTLARQFEYVGSSSNIQNQRIRGLSLSALIADGLVSSSKRYNILMEADGTSGDVKPFVSNIEYGDYETKLMKGVKSAMTASTMAWRAEANDLMKRMGDLRLSPNDTGIWARVYRGKSTSNKDNTDFRMNYSTIQVGCDKKVGRDWRVGVAGSYMSGSSAYAAGNGKNKEGNLGVYGTWTGKSGQYVDLIAKIGRLQNEYTVYNDFGHYVKGDYSMWGGSLSAEYGKRISMKDGSFVEPQIELIYSHMQGTNYVGSTDYSGMSMYVHQKPFDSFIGRIGFGFGKETERSTYYARASLYHEFAGDMHTDYSDGFTPKSTMQRGKDTWVGVQLGGTLKLSDKTNLYGNFEKTFGGDIKTAWRMDAGMRWIF